MHEALTELWELSVRVPSQRPLRFGVHGTTHHEAHRQMLRHPKDEFDLIVEAAHILGLAPAVFTSEAARNVALALLKKVKEKDNDNHTNLGGG